MWHRARCRGKSFHVQCATAAIVGALGGFRETIDWIGLVGISNYPGHYEMVSLMMTAIIAKGSPSVDIISCKKSTLCLMSTQTQPFYHPFWSPSVICPLNWLQSKVWIDRAWVNWPQFRVPEAFWQGDCLPSWCLIQSLRWRRSSLAVRSLTHTFTRRGRGSVWTPGGGGTKGVRLAPPALQSQYLWGQ